MEGGRIFTKYKYFFIRLTDKILHQLLLQKLHTWRYLKHPNCLAGFCTRVCSSSPSKGPCTLNGTHRPGLKYTTPPENFAKVWVFFNIWLLGERRYVEHLHQTSTRMFPIFTKKDESCPKKPGEAQLVLVCTMTTEQRHTRTTLMIFCSTHLSPSAWPNWPLELSAWILSPNRSLYVVNCFYTPVEICCQ